MQEARRRERHPLERGVEDVDFVDACRRNRLYGPRHGLAFDDGAQLVAVALAHLLRIVEQRIVEVGRQDDGGGEYRTGQTAASRFVAPRFERIRPVSVCEHHGTKIRKVERRSKR